MQKTSETKKILEKELYKQLDINASTLKEWETDTYPVDGYIISKFWKEIEKAPYVQIVGDYDVDGICASHILSTSIRSLYPQKKVSVRIPRRFSEGYGINDVIADELITKLPSDSLIITVDNGIAAANVLERLRTYGFTVIVTDHHEAKENTPLPVVDMLIDPAVTNIPNPLTGKYWCGAGVAFKLCEPMLKEEIRKELECFAGLATVADCMELKEGNWALVRRAIKTFREKKAPKSFKMLLKEMGKDANFCNEEDFGFYLGPAFNAPGRLLDKGAIEVLKYLYNPTEEDCKQIVFLNNERKRIRDEEYEQIKTYIFENGLADTYPLWVSYPNLHEGIVGILAGKLAEDFKRPAIVLTNIESTPGMLKGSARSYGDFNIFNYLSEMSGLFTKMGGHKGAAGLSMTVENFEKARKNQLNLMDIQKVSNLKEIHLSIEKWEIPGIYRILNKFRPFGEGNANPKFEVEIDTQKDKARFIGKEANHLLIQDKAGKWKLTHFNHKPNNLSDTQKFGLRGTINGSAFAGIETPSFNADEIFDIIDCKEKGK